jgi:hypothetical protein
MIRTVREAKLGKLTLRLVEMDSNLNGMSRYPIRNKILHVSIRKPNCRIRRRSCLLS